MSVFFLYELKKEAHVYSNSKREWRSCGLDRLWHHSRSSNHTLMRVANYTTIKVWNDFRITGNSTRHLSVEYFHVLVWLWGIDPQWTSILSRECCSLYSYGYFIICLTLFSCLIRSFCVFRFHLLAEFDDTKRSCRKRLDGHNRRRRKPQPDTMASASFIAAQQAGLLFSTSSPCFSVCIKFRYIFRISISSYKGKQNKPVKYICRYMRHEKLISGSTLPLCSFLKPFEFMYVAELKLGS